MFTNEDNLDNAQMVKRILDLNASMSSAIGSTTLNYVDEGGFLSSIDQQYGRLICKNQTKG